MTKYTATLRLTERLFTDFGSILGRMRSAASVEPGGSDLGRIVRRVADEVTSFGVPTLQDDEPHPTGGEYVCWRQVGHMAVDVTVVQPTTMDGNIMHRVEMPVDQRAKGWVGASRLEPSADAGSWSRDLWNRATEEFEEQCEWKAAINRT